MNDNVPQPEWCVVATLLPYPYRPGPNAEHRSHKIYPAGAKLHVIGGFAGMGHKVVTVVGSGHRRRLVTAHIQARYLGGWRVALIYRPAVLNAIHRAVHYDNVTGHRWNQQGFELSAPEYAEHLRSIAQKFQLHLHG
ncbi:hypothetical protein AB0M45_20695 [Nocardia sp. NPDC051787]|uniref:hypothetical protein n=1 Tax=Nocardia sp. NPDC051787 TaxID=3155415 RepID=UPI003416612F